MAATELVAYYLPHGVDAALEANSGLPSSIITVEFMLSP